MMGSHTSRQQTVIWILYSGKANEIAVFQFREDTTEGCKRSLQRDKNILCYAFWVAQEEILCNYHKDNTF